MSFEGTDVVGTTPSRGILNEPEEGAQVFSDGSEATEAESDELSFSEEPVSVVDPDALSALGQAAAARGYLWIPLKPPGPAHRGRLGLFIEETIENELEERGALPPGIVASTGLDASVSDQLYRARLIEMRGIALGIPTLEGVTNLGRTLDADDSSVLRWWMAATSDRPVRLLISNQNTKLRVYPAPIFFDSLFESAPTPVSPRAPSVDMAESAESMSLSDLPPPVIRQEETNVFGTEVDVAFDRTSRGSSDEHTDVDDEYLIAEDDVDLSDLDQALGLAPPVVDGMDRDEVDVQSADSLTGSADAPKSNRETSGQLALDYGPGTRNEESAASSMAQSWEVEDLARETADAEGELNTEEFLRTLEEDSARMPSVDEDSSYPIESSNEDQVPSVSTQQDSDPEGADELASDQSVVAESPESHSELPTKKIARKPFIRLAQNEAPDEPSAPAPEAAEAVEAKRRPIISSQPLEDLGFRDESAPESAESPIKDVRPEMDEEDTSADKPGSELQPKAPVAKTAPPVDPDDPFNQLAAQKWQSWMSNLIAARGPKPLSVIERMFVTDYTRLREAVRRGVAGETANAVLDEWRNSFESSYAEAYDALRVRGKRPTMVLDLPELAKRLGRLQGAKRVQLFLVDGMRFDLGLMIQERMRKTAPASLTERLLMWSALPSVTSHQLELLGRGLDGLKESPQLDESPALVARGRAALTPRRVRTGSLEILKLDIVEDMLRQPGLPVLERMADIADVTAEAITTHIEKLPERTMVVVFGDHGFALDPKAEGTTAEVKQGGASPEEVLVPAFAWLTGAVH